MLTTLLNVAPLLMVVLFQDDGEGAALIGSFGSLCCSLILAIVVPGILLFKVFEKAGKPTWAAFVPIYNYYIMLEIVGRPGWWVIGFFIPLINLAVWILLSLDLAKSFGKDTTYAIGIILLPIVFLPLLGFGDAQYLGPSAPTDGSLM